MDHAKYMVADVTKSIKGMKIKDGTNLLNTSPGGLKLSAVVKGDRILRYVITDAKGNVIPSTHHKDPATAQAKATTCWECGVDAAGDRHCWKVPCPDIVGPWMVNASAVKSAQ